ncbi:hypothetical protein Btru_035059 [Bulinus truncatus]|nr:hypothetical protein Btru_035059 [Bulinus truncatus]
MINAIFTTCAFIARCVEVITAGVKYLVNLNYDLVAAVVKTLSSAISAITSLYNYIKPIFCIILDSLTELYSSITSLFIMIFMVFQFIFNIAQIGSLCVNFVTGVWQGLGFVISSVAYFPVYCMQCIDEFVEDSWRNLTQTCVHILNATTKETYLGIVLLCLFYLTLSNAVRYMNSRGLTLFPQRFTHRNLRERRTNSNWDFDRGFESDFEDMYGSDVEDGHWMHETTNDSDSNNDDDSVSSISQSSDISDSDSDEYTIVTEESDSDASINSQTFSTESSDHEIEVQLPQVDERYTLRNRSSTPSHVPKFMNTPEDFDREMEKERDKRKCVICQDEIKSVLVLPCKHLCMCVLCADQIVRSQIAGRRVCPLCRCKITKVMNIYV